jgi:hypothetical protein
MRGGDAPGAARFDHHAPGANNAIVYLGVNVQHPTAPASTAGWEAVASAAEAVPHRLTIAAARDLLTRQLVTGHLAHDVDALDLTGPLLQDLRTGAHLTSSPDRPTTQAWARWLHRHPPFAAAHGLYWHSAQQTRLDVIALNERATAAYAIDDVHDVADPATLRVIIAAMADAGVRPTPQAAAHLQALL